MGLPFFVELTQIGREMIALTQRELIWIVQEIERETVALVKLLWELTHPRGVVAFKKRALLNWYRFPILLLLGRVDTTLISFCRDRYTS
jgi:hypothetical protein